jgi:hypothetical protein
VVPPRPRSQTLSRLAASHPRLHLHHSADDDAAAVQLQQEAPDGGEAGRAHVGLPARRLRVGPHSAEARVDSGGRVEPLDGPAPGVGHAPDLAHLRGRQVPRVGLDVADCGTEAGAPREAGAQLGHTEGPAQPRGVLRGHGRGEVLPELLHHAAAHHVVRAPVQVLREERGVNVDPEEAARGVERGAEAPPRHRHKALGQ